MSSTNVTRLLGVAALIGILAVASGCTVSPPDRGTTSGSAEAAGLGRGPLAQVDFAGVVDVGEGRQIWASCQGQGSPTVVLISGHGNGAEDWSLILDPNDPAHDAPLDDVSAGMGALTASDDAVYPTLAKGTRVCTYDRPDIRVGDAVTTPREQEHSVDLDVSDLHKLLSAIGEPGPYVLVAHSYGGLVATLFSRTYPESIAGVVMVDTVSERMQDIVAPGALDWWDDVNAATNDVVREGVMVKDAFDQINASGPMPDVPAAVLVADKPFRDMVGPEVEHTTFADWQAMVGLLAEDLGVEVIHDTRSGHNIYLYNPQLVIDSIREVISMAREEGTSAAADFSGLVDIGGRDIYVQCTGTGSPTVVLVSGNPIAADLWDSPLGLQPTVYQTVANDTRVCAYDRPGTTRAIEGGGNSRSDPVPQPITPADSVRELHDLLAAIGENEPVVLAGHSFGGAIARLFAHTYPEAVSGLVMVDSFTPELRDNFPADMWTLWKQQNAMSPDLIADYPDIERFDFDESSDILRDGGSIQPIPLVVLTADAPITDEPKPGLPDIAAATAAAHHAAQDHLANLAPGARHVTQTHSGHNMMLDNPAIVTGAILDVVDAVRDGRAAV